MTSGSSVRQSYRWKPLTIYSSSRSMMAKLYGCVSALPLAKHHFVFLSVWLPSSRLAAVSLSFMASLPLSRVLPMLTTPAWSACAAISP